MIDGVEVPEARLAVASDLPSLLELFATSEISRVAEPLAKVEHVWWETLAHPGVHVLVSDAGGRIAATCMLAARRTAARILKNVVVHPAPRGRGHGRTVIGVVLARA